MSFIPKLGKKSGKVKKTKYSVLPGLQYGQRFPTCPNEFKSNMSLKQGIVYKQKTCVLKKGNLTIYNGSIEKETHLADIDLGTSIVSHQTSNFLSINSDDQIYRFKVKDKTLFQEWLKHLKHHRWYRQDQLQFGHAHAASTERKGAVADKTEHANTAEAASGSDEVMNRLNSIHVEMCKKFEEMEKLKQSVDLREKSVEFCRKAQECNKLISRLLHELKLERQKFDEAKKRIKHEELGTTMEQRDESLKASLGTDRERSVKSYGNRSFHATTPIPISVSPASKLPDIKILPPAQKKPDEKSSLSPSSFPSKSSPQPTSPPAVTNLPSVPKTATMQPKMVVSPSKDAADEVKSEFDQQTEGDEDNAAVGDRISATKSLLMPAHRTSSKFRTSLPAQTIPSNVSILSFLRIGREMSRLSLPVEMFEPLSALQLLCEELEYSELLDQATKEDDKCKRMVLIACFAISRYAATAHRGQRKPFNPLEGETYENVRDDLGWKYFGEQVSHYPHVSACHGKGSNWEFWQTAIWKVAFWGKSIEAEQTTPVNVILTNFGERYTWNKVTTSVHNLFRGEKYCDHYGKMIIKCSNYVSCKITFKKFSGNSKHEVSGTIHDTDGSVKHSIFGKWSEALYLGVPNKKLCIWKCVPQLPQSNQYYGFGLFAFSLNELTADLGETLPPTDSRFRPDQRLLEEGKTAEANARKTQLEENQRNRRKQRQYKSKWFKKEKQDEWKFTNEYWDAKELHFENTKFEKLW